MKQNYLGVTAPKDEARVARAISSIRSKIEASIAKMDARRSRMREYHEYRFAQMCADKGLIYSPLD